MIITILTNAAAIDAVYYGDHGLLAGEVKGKLFIEMSTVRPETERALAEWVAKKHAQLVECPVGGTVGPAKEGKLFGLVGADAMALDRARPLLEQMCRRVEHVGPVGAGAAMKLAINLPLIVFWQAFGEAVALTKPLGIDPARLVEIFSDTSGAATVLKNRGAAVAKALAGEDTGPGDLRSGLDAQGPAHHAGRGEQPGRGTAHRGARARSLRSRRPRRAWRHRRRAHSGLGERRYGGLSASSAWRRPGLQSACLECSIEFG